RPPRCRPRPPSSMRWSTRRIRGRSGPGSPPREEILRARQARAAPRRTQAPLFERRRQRSRTALDPGDLGTEEGVDVTGVVLVAVPSPRPDELHARVMARQPREDRVVVFLEPGPRDVARLRTIEL